MLLPVSILALLALVQCSPLAAPGFNSFESSIAPRQDNCTTYSSVSAGTVCIHTPSDCIATYLVESGDSCQAIVNKFNNFTYSIFYYWNPDIGQSCLGLRAFVPVCISTPWYTFTPPVQLAPKTIVPASDIPVPIMPGIVDNCAKFELVGGGLRVDAITSDNNIILDDFVSWNTLVKKDDPVLWDGYWVCIGV